MQAIENRRFLQARVNCLGRRGSGVQIAPPRPIESNAYARQLESVVLLLEKLQLQNNLQLPGEEFSQLRLYAISASDAHDADLRFEMTRIRQS